MCHSLPTLLRPLLQPGCRKLYRKVQLCMSRMSRKPSCSHRVRTWRLSPASLGGGLSHWQVRSCLRAVTGTSTVLCGSNVYRFGNDTELNLITWTADLVPRLVDGQCPDKCECCASLVGCRRSASRATLAPACHGKFGLKRNRARASTSLLPRGQARKPERKRNVRFQS